MTSRSEGSRRSAGTDGKPNRLRQTTHIAVRAHQRRVRRPDCRAQPRHAAMQITLSMAVELLLNDFGLFCTDIVSAFGAGLAVLVAIL
ncbi:MAG: hypothetical protein WB762_03430 [Candidatus Sulfotelmatobacter sp.]